MSCVCFQLVQLKNKNKEEFSKVARAEILNTSSKRSDIVVAATGTCRERDNSVIFLTQQLRVLSANNYEYIQITFQVNATKQNSPHYIDFIGNVNSK